MAASKNLTPEQRSERARLAAGARHSLAAAVRRVLRDADKLTSDQRRALAAAVGR